MAKSLPISAIWANLPTWFLDSLRAVKGKRVKAVIRHILTHGAVTTEQLSKKYGYIHPPRAKQDAKEVGIPLVAKRVKSSKGKSIASYTFDTDAILGTATGRSPIPKVFRKELEKANGLVCAICQNPFESRLLQVDHRVPFEVAGDQVANGKRDPSDFMLACPSCNSRKRKSCESCPNAVTQKQTAICKTCYWASPSNYEHVATVPQRVISLSWVGTEVADYDALATEAAAVPESVPDRLKGIVSERYRKRKSK